MLELTIFKIKINFFSIKRELIFTFQIELSLK